MCWSGRQGSPRGPVERLNPEWRWLMSCLGSLVAITAEQRAELEALPNGEDRYFYVDDLKEGAGEEFWQYLDKAWDALHRCWPRVRPVPRSSTRSGEPTRSILPSLAAKTSANRT